MCGYVQVPDEATGIGILGVREVGSWELLNVGPLQEQYVLLTVEPFLFLFSVPHSGFRCWLFFF